MTTMAGVQDILGPWYCLETWNINNFNFNNPWNKDMGFAQESNAMVSWMTSLKPVLDLHAAFLVIWNSLLSCEVWFIGTGYVTVRVYSCLTWLIWDGTALSFCWSIYLRIVSFRRESRASFLQGLGPTLCDNVIFSSWFTLSKLRESHYYSWAAKLLDL